MFGRFQLNFHAEPHSIDTDKFCEVFRQKFVSKPIIFQIDGVNDKVYHSLEGRRGIQAFPLFDLSGGAGLVPKAWPDSRAYHRYCGYAGGLSPVNLEEQMGRISEVVNGPIWIDAETLLRSEDDTTFQIEAAQRFLEAARPWICSI